MASVYEVCGAVPSICVVDFILPRRVTFRLWEGSKAGRDPAGHGSIGALAPTEPRGGVTVPFGDDPRVRVCHWHTLMPRWRA
jgi:hypothetical protein